MLFLCALKKFFDAQRIDDAGYSAVRTQKAIIILFMLSVFFAITLFFLSSLGLYIFVPLLFIFPMYWLILAVGFKGARTRSPRLLFTFFLSKAFFELALLSSLALLFLLIGVATIADAEAESGQEGDHQEQGASITPASSSTTPTPESRQFANPSETYSHDEPQQPSDENVQDGTDVSDGESDGSDGTGVPNSGEDDHDKDEETREAVAVVSVFSLVGVMCFAGLLHFVTTLVTLILTMRTFVLLKRAQLLPIVKKARAAKKAAKRARRAAKKAAKKKAAAKAAPVPAVAPTVVPSTYAPETIQMYAGAQYQPMVYVIPMPPQE
jgi:hypothetical protein